MYSLFAPDSISNSVPSIIFVSSPFVLQFAHHALRDEFIIVFISCTYLAIVQSIETDLTLGECLYQFDRESAGAAAC